VRGTAALIQFPKQSTEVDTMALLVLLVDTFWPMLNQNIGFMFE